MRTSMKALDKRLLEESQAYVKHLAGSRSEPDVRQTAWLWDFYYKSKTLLTYNRTKKMKNVESHSA